MMNAFARRALSLVTAAILAACRGSAPSSDHVTSPSIHDRLAQYTNVHLTADLSALTPKERAMLPLLIEAARIMDGIYWKETYGNRDSLLAAITDTTLRRYVEVNYGPWDRLADDAPFVPGVGPKPKGAEFYPHDMTTGEFETAAAESPARAAALKSLYTLVRRDATGRLVTVPYREAYAVEVKAAAAKV